MIEIGKSISMRWKSGSRAPRHYWSWRRGMQRGWWEGKRMGLDLELGIMSRNFISISLEEDYDNNV
jgi:hypothetical protein